jgi:hypothetical protein
MKKLLFLVLAAIAGTVQAQDVKKAKDFLAAKQLEPAKAAIDATMANPKNAKNAEAWYTKGKIYSAIAADKTLQVSNPTARMESLDAFKKAIESDKNQATVFMTLDNYQPIFNLYTSGFEEAAGFLNNSKPEDALKSFKQTSTVGDYIYGQGWGLYKLDTTVTFYSGIAAMNASTAATKEKRTEDAATYEKEAVGYFTKLADAKVGGNPDYATSYRYLAKYYYDKNDVANMNKYIALGKEQYPKDDYLPLLELDYLREKGDKAALYAKYEEALKINPNNFDVITDYAATLFSDTHVTDATKRPADYDQKCAKIEELYTRAIALKPESMESELSLGKHYYNMALFSEDDVNRIKGAKPEDVKKKADLNAQIVSLSDKAIPHLEKVFTHYDGMGHLKVAERSNLKSSCSLLSYCYDKKKDKSKSDFYQKKYDEADKTHQ